MGLLCFSIWEGFCSPTTNSLNALHIFDAAAMRCFARTDGRTDGPSLLDRLWLLLTRRRHCCWVLRCLQVPPTLAADFVGSYGDFFLEFIAAFLDCRLLLDHLIYVYALMPTPS